MGENELDRLLGFQKPFTKRQVEFLSNLNTTSEKDPNMQRRKLHAMIEGLTDREKGVIGDYYLNGQHYSGIGGKLRTHRSRAERLVRRAETILEQEAGVLPKPIMRRRDRK